MIQAILTTRGARWPFLGTRALIFILMALLVGACGREAPPRAASPTTAPPTRAPSPATPLTQAAMPAGTAAPREDDPRAQGEPNAPIVVIEYGDYQ
jgi:hypothetical protein